ncbi:hypothetical protein [Mucilaginibacter aquariorum]|uniref:Uncharacterized protein n=1 Tax=Mucilaginibacter aquariorum TaxID=2967225 RepID=A0ABT1T634_9SPHI|nr:hypothetical protein [Mucilaginibacter aquariorum]MCQ6960042.1 hypothetical protein [Mucilaginibacter aquariorum]
MKLSNLQKPVALLLLILTFFIGNSCKKVLNDPSAKEEINRNLNLKQYAGEPKASKITFQQFLEETKGINTTILQKLSQKNINSSRQICF